MIGNNHIQIPMSIIRLVNEKKKSSGKNYIDNIGMMKIESKFIKFANYVNSIENKIYNNKLSNWLKDIFEHKMDYPVYMYSDQTNQYVYDMVQGIIQEGEDKGKNYADVSVTDNIKYAKDFRYVPKRQRNKLLIQANKVLAGIEFPFTVRFKSVMNVEANLTDDVVDINA